MYIINFCCGALSANDGEGVGRVVNAMIAKYYSKVKLNNEA